MFPPLMGGVKMINAVMDRDNSKPSSRPSPNSRLFPLLWRGGWGPSGVPHVLDG